ncbi:MAG: hypothetical protein ACO1N9_13860 [Flavobacterium sp.]
MKKIYTLLLLLISLTVSAQERITLDIFGFSIQPPEGWYEADKKEMLENLDKFELTDEFREQALKDLSKDNRRLTYYKYDPLKTRGIIPTITLLFKPVKIKTAEAFRQTIEAIEKRYPEMLKNYKTVSVVSTTVGGQRAIRVISTYNLNDPTGDEVLLSAIAIYIYRGTYFIKSTLVEQINKEDNSEVYDEMLKTIILK